MQMIVLQALHSKEFIMINILFQLSCFYLIRIYEYLS